MFNVMFQERLLILPRLLMDILLIRVPLCFTRMTLRRRVCRHRFIRVQIVWRLAFCGRGSRLDDVLSCSCFFSAYIPFFGVDWRNFIIEKEVTFEGRVSYLKSSWPL